MDNFNPVPKKTYKKRKPSRKKRGEFSKETTSKILEKFENKCGVCGGIPTEIHHVMYKSRGGRGVLENGMPVCQQCHFEIHQNKKLSDFWIWLFESKYGPDFYKDEYDIN